MDKALAFILLILPRGGAFTLVWPVVLRLWLASRSRSARISKDGAHTARLDTSVPR